MAKQQQKGGTRAPAGAQAGTTGTTAATTGRQADSDAIALLKADHRKVEKLFQQYPAADSDDSKVSLARQICNELIIHAQIEEELFYPACRAQGVEHDMLDEAQVEHDGAKVLVTELMTLPVSSEFYDAKVKVLSEYIKHHVGEEERPGSGLFASAQKAGLDMNALGPRLQARKQKLTTQADTEGFSPPRPRSLRARSTSTNYQEDQTMARYGRERDDDYGSGRSSRGGGSSGGNYRERDDQGRFMSDEDEGGRGGRSYGEHSGREGSSGRGQGGWFGDSEGHSESSRQGWEERGAGGNYRSSGRGGYEEDEGGGRSPGRGRGHGGWFGDPEGHPEERGGGYRSSGRGGYGEDEGNGGRSSGRGRGHGGWFGDPEGHSEGSRQAWDERGSSSGSSSRSSRAGGSGGGGRDYGDRSSSDRAGGNGDNRGWHGDSRGHAGAARRGWQNR